MKLLYIFLLALLASSAAFSQSPNYVIVKGHIAYSNGSPVSNWPVYIMPDSITTPSSCMQVHSRFTNPNGNYQDTLYCSSNINAVIVTTANCNNTNLAHYDSVPANHLVEDNFTICTPGTAQCHAVVTGSVTGLMVSFNSTASTVATGTTITQRYWTFGDGTSMTGNVAQPSHTYTAGGTYTVRLVITSSSQCRDTAVYTVTVAASTTCEARYLDSITGHVVYFYSGSSSTGSGDSIVERHWTFGDGTTLGGNVVNPTHTYANSGTYTVCLKIFSARQCSDSICKTVVIGNTTSCSASFVFTRSGNVFTFNSSASQTSAPDVIVQRKWSFGNGDSLGGNVISPTHTYTQTGQYTVCLTIFTQLGCSKTFCSVVSIVDSSCHAGFSFTNTSASNVISFSSTSTSGAGSTIIHHYWSFGDGDTLMSNNTAPSHIYTTPGTYNVCLTIVTSNGCQSTICKQVVINPVVSCHAAFSDSVLGSSVYFYSGATTGDSIVERHWTFGDGTSLGGNVTNTLHAYNNSGTYTVCLKITSARQCTDSICKTVVVASTATCVSSFTSTRSGNTFTFNSTASHGVSPDVIVRRLWNFGNDTLGGNVVSPVHTFSQNGVYNVCLTIYTQGGCSKTYCQTVSLVDSSCHSNFTYTTANSVVSFTSTAIAGNAGATIVHRYWSFGDGDSSMANVTNPTHQYNAPGTYHVCLTIATSTGCQSTECKQVVVSGAVSCHAYFYDTTASATGSGIQFYSNLSSTGAGDSIVQRQWTFGDGTSLNGNVVNPTHNYTANGTYTVCLRIISARQCSDSMCKVVVVSVQPHCEAKFTSNDSLSVIKFNSNTSTVPAGDTIVARYWSFGDSTFLGGNVVDPSHSYLHAGTYNVCLTISTSRGCQSSVCHTVTVVAIPTSCKARFSYTRFGNLSIHFNGLTSITTPGDYIVQRRWSFGDGSSLSGNVVDPVKTYQSQSSYNVCLHIVTYRGCVSDTCMLVRVGDSTAPGDTSRPVQLVSVNPNPATTQFTSTIWSRYNSVTAELSIFDMYGIKKWGTTKQLLSGNNAFVIPISSLVSGPYTFRVTTMYGVLTKQFYKL